MRESCNDLSKMVEETRQFNGNVIPIEPGAVTVVLGAQWGDEGKGKVIDFLIGHSQVDVTARCQGGNNAGHTVVANGKKYDFHLIPSGLVNESCHNVIGNGVVLNLDALFDELEHNGFSRGVMDWEKRLVISNRCHLVFGVHIQADGQQEGLLGDTKKIGTTNRGIGPTYSSKCFRNGIRLADLMGDFEDFSKRYHTLVQHYKTQFPNINVNEQEELARLKKHAENLQQLGIVVETSSLLHKKRLAGQSILVEGANGALLDIDFGTYPFVTSSNSTVGGACTGLGVPPTAIKHVVGVVKAYQTRVGTGPFPTEQLNKDGDKLQSIGCEVGVTTGRKRRCGWLDLILLRTANIINGFTAIALTKLDILDSFEEIKVGVSYELDGQQLLEAPARAADWDRIQVQYKSFKGWKSDTSNIRNFEDLPLDCKAYVKFIEDFVDVPVKYIGVGEARENLIVR
uniref:Adenylosuccinate synthetase n=1 Tax=Ditylenchus dipsaci TaxID=166011 RepID=A0A915D1L2_9BILA